MTEISLFEANLNLCDSFQSITNSSLLSFKFMFCGLFKSWCNYIPNVDFKSLILSKANSGLLSVDELEIILKYLTEDSYEVNSNQTIYAFKKTGKAFFINKSYFDSNIYLHQTNIGSSTVDSYKDLMYILLILFSEDIPQFNRQQLELILKLLPKVCYQVNSDQTIYSFKVNGKPFFVDKSLCHPEEISRTSETVEHLYEISLESRTLGQKFAAKSRLVFMSFKDYERDMKRRLVEELVKTGHIRQGKKWVSKTPLKPEIYLNRPKFIPQNNIYDDPKQVTPILDKWDKSLVRRKLYQRSEFMIRMLSIKEVKYILNQCKESLFDRKERNERRKKVKADSNLKPVIGCDLLKQTLYSIIELEDTDLLEL